jgi:hypothetical protein
MTNDQRIQIADDLDGDGLKDNSLGGLIGVLNGQADISVNGDDMIAAGVLASSLTIQGSNLDDDAAVSVTFFGADGEPATAMSGAFAHGALLSNPTREHQDLGAARVHLPIFEDIDPTVIDFTDAEIDLAPDGSGGYTVILRGVIPTSEVLPAVGSGMVAMIDADPQAHVPLAGIVDLNHDGVITETEVESTTLVKSLAAPDLTDGMSAAIQFHAIPCASGSCVTAPPADTCGDRLKDGDEVDIDCGGSCGACPAGAACGSGADCQSETCDGSACAAPTCTDGVLDGFETSTDDGEACPG